MLSLPILLLQAAPQYDEEFNLFLFAILVLGIAFICISAIVAIACVVLLLLIIFGFIAVGALSTSVIVGINKKSFTTGFRTFVIVFSTFASGVAGVGSIWLLNRLLHWWPEAKAIAIGLGIGLVSGFITGLLLALVIKKMSTFLKNKLQKRRSTNGKSLQESVSSRS